MALWNRKKLRQRLSLEISLIIFCNEDSFFGNESDYVFWQKPHSFEGAMFVKRIIFKNQRELDHAPEVDDISKTTSTCITRAMEKGLMDKRSASDFFQESKIVPYFGCSDRQGRPREKRTLSTKSLTDSGSATLVQSLSRSIFVENLTQHEIIIASAP